MKISCVDLFCGVGGLTAGLESAGIHVKAGIDIDANCEWSYSKNTNAKYILEDVTGLTSEKLNHLFGKSDFRLLAGCAPCQPFSTYGNSRKSADDRWKLLKTFRRLVRETKPGFVTMENVPGLAKHEVFHSFLRSLKELGYDYAWSVLKCEDYGIPQTRKRLVLIASRVTQVTLPGPTFESPRTVEEAISTLSPLGAGEQSSSDPLHISSSLNSKNLKRIRHSRPGGTWRDWPKSLIAECHAKDSGKTYSGVYGRMSWDQPSPTITTQCFGFGNGRFGHPTQDRAISLREAAILQSFPPTWKFVAEDEIVRMKKLGRAIGNAVPPKLGEVIGKHIVQLANQ